MVNLSVFDHLGPILGPSGPFWTILDKNDFFAPNGQRRGWQRCFGAKYQFLFLQSSRLVFHGFSWFQVGFSWFFSKMYPLELYPGPTILRAKPTRPKTGFGLVLVIIMIMVMIVL